LATTVYDVEEIQLQNGATVKLKPLTIKELRKFMAAIAKTAEVTTEDETLTILIDACAVALEKQLPDLVKDRDAFEDTLDVPTINRILEICGGIKMDDPNLLAAAVLAGQN
jgi:phosphohistidine swiveling domain-containing protein